MARGTNARTPMTVIGPVGLRDDLISCHVGTGNSFMGGMRNYRHIEISEEDT